MKKIILLLLLPQVMLSQIKVNFQKKPDKPSFELVTKHKVVSIFYDPAEPKLIGITAHLFAEDIERITGKKPEISTDLNDLKGNVVILGTLAHGKVIASLAERHKEIGTITGHWEQFILKTISKPTKGIDEALVIAGSDKRGAAYGALSLSEKLGVSPWYWWADVPVPKATELSIENLTYTSQVPTVKYRGIFLNDEAPALSNWAKATFGGFNHQFYKKVFELLLRNKANYLWPAMWPPSAFSDDDPLNPKLADDYGIVMSTSHHEPMMRAHAEWGHFGGGTWNYETNKAQLQEFWRGGIERMGDYESVVTIGMRGDGDEAMSENAAVDLMKNIVMDQRRIITAATGKPAEKTPQVWAIYKEVQEYYDKGMRVPDDVMILFCDDNWGNVRMLPKKEDRNKKRGYGMYYHFDFVGGPVSYRWQNVTQIERVWEQMTLAYNWGIKDLWLVNVGDLKPMEFPMSFFLDLAYNVNEFNAETLPAYYETWAAQQFGKAHAPAIAEIISRYTKYNARRTPEMLKPDTYSLDNYREADGIVTDYRQLMEKSKRIYGKLPENYRSAYNQLVHLPISMCANLNAMYVAAAKNKVYGEQGRASANYYAEKVKELFDLDAELTRQYHEDLEHGKWNHMMSQTHIGYTYWNNPPANKMPAVAYIQTQKQATIGYQLELGAAAEWSGTKASDNGLFGKSFSPFDPINDQHYNLVVFNGGDENLTFAITPKAEWIKVSSKGDTLQYDRRIEVSIDWDKAPNGNATGELVLSGAGNDFIIQVPIRNGLPKASGFVENNGVVSIDAAHVTRLIAKGDIHWTVVPNLGRTLAAIIAEPMTIERQIPMANGARAEYDFTVFEDGDLTIETYVSPTQNYQKNEGLKFAIAIDDEVPHILNINEGELKPDYEYPDWWMDAVADHIKISTSLHKTIKAGSHTLKVWIMDPGVVIQKFVIDAGGLKPSYLGPPESRYLEE